MECTEETDEGFENRTLVCTVTSPAGRRLGTFKSRMELLLALRDAIKAHQSLFQDGRIIHRDVSATNIVIVDSESEGRPVGFLIDLEVALHIDVGPRTPGEVTGTRPFMAIGILKGRHRTYRHDLESFLYVLVWMLITNGEHSPPDTSLLRGWSRGTREDSAMQKMRYMTKDSFPTILAEFPLQFHHLSSLAETLRAILFPVMDDGTIWTGTDSMAVDEIYDGMIGAFEEAIAQELTEI